MPTASKTELVRTLTGLSQNEWTLDLGWICDMNLDRSPDRIVWTNMSPL